MYDWYILNYLISLCVYVCVLHSLLTPTACFLFTLSSPTPDVILTHSIWYCGIEEWVRLKSLISRDSAQTKAIYGFHYVLLSTFVISYLNINRSNESCVKPDHAQFVSWSKLFNPTTLSKLLRSTALNNLHSALSDYWHQENESFDRKYYIH